MSPPFCLPLQVTLAVNKCENAAKADLQAADFWGLGLEPIAVSAISGSGTGELLDHLVEHMKPPPDAEEVEPDTGIVSVAIVGRPNVGKSSLVNAITGVAHGTASSIPGDSEMNWHPALDAQYDMHAPILPQQSKTL